MKDIINDCLHNFVTSIYRNTEICINCGVLSIEGGILNKTKDYNKICEFDKMQTLDVIKKNDKKINIKNSEYLKRRDSIVEYLSKLIEVCKYSERTFYLAMQLIDAILVKKCYFTDNKKYDLVTIGCLLLSGINISKLAKCCDNDVILPDYGVFLTPKKSVVFENRKRFCLNYLNWFNKS